MFIWQRKLKYRLGISGCAGKTKRYSSYSVYKRQIVLRRIKIFAVCTAFTIGIIYLLTDIEKRISPLINDMALSNLNSIVLKECSEVIGNEVAEYDLSYDSLIKKQNSADNSIKSLSVDYSRLNILKSEMTKEIQTRIDKINSVDINIPLMAFISDRFYSGVGVPLSIRVLTDENVRIDFYDEFVTQGINQTKHLIMVRVIIDMGLNVPVRQNGAPIEAEIPIAESIIAGDVPDTYLDFN